MTYQKFVEWLLSLQLESSCREISNEVCDADELEFSEANETNTERVNLHYTITTGRDVEDSVFADAMKMDAPDYNITYDTVDMKSSLYGKLGEVFSIFTFRLHYKQVL